MKHFILCPVGKAQRQTDPKTLCKCSLTDENWSRLNEMKIEMKKIWLIPPKNNTNMRRRCHTMHYTGSWPHSR